VAKPMETYKNMYGYLLDPIHDEHERFKNIIELSNDNIVTSLMAAMGVWSLASQVI
jgi:hypothetical protein